MYIIYIYIYIYIYISMISSFDVFRIIDDSATIKVHFIAYGIISADFCYNI